MKKKKINFIVVIILILALIPIPMKLKDGGSVEYKAILYEVKNIIPLILNQQKDMMMA